MRSTLCIDLLFVCLILISSRIFWYKESRVWWDYPRSLLRTCEVYCRNFTVAVSWWCSLCFWLSNGVILEYIFVNHCHLLVGSETRSLCKAAPVLSWLIKKKPTFFSWTSGISLCLCYPLKGRKRTGKQIYILFLFNPITKKRTWRVHEGTFDVSAALFCRQENQQMGAVAEVLGRL